MSLIGLCFYGCEQLIPFDSWTDCKGMDLRGIFLFYGQLKNLKIFKNLVCSLVAPGKMLSLSVSLLACLVMASLTICGTILRNP